MNQVSKNKKTLKGTVVSDKMQKTIVVSVTELKKHRRYHKFYKSSKKYKAHDASGQYHVGDQVIIQESRPISRDKHWIVLKKI